MRVIHDWKDDLASSGLLLNEATPETLFRIVSRSVRCLNSDLVELHLSLGITIDREEDVYLDFDHPLWRTKEEPKIKIFVDWRALLVELISQKTAQPERSWEALIPKIVTTFPALSTSFVDDSRISMDTLMTSVKEIAGRAGPLKDRKLSLLDLVRSGHGDLLAVADRARERNEDIIENLRGVHLLQSENCAEAPLWMEGSIFLLDTHLNMRRPGLLPGEKHSSLEYGLDKEWFRERSALAAFAQYRLSPDGLINTWGLDRFFHTMEDEAVAPIDESGEQVISDAVDGAVRFQEQSLEWDRESFTSMGGAFLRFSEAEILEAGKDLAPIRFNDINGQRRTLRLMSGYSDLAKAYFGRAYSESTSE